jgi:class 3 adenylate cyclase
MLQRALRFAYHRLGPRYPRAALALLFALAYVVGLAGVALLRLYQDMSANDVMVIAAAVVGLVFVENLLAARVAVKLVAPAEAWLSGNRTESTAVQAWTALAGLPQDFLSTRRWMAVFMNVIPITVFVTWLLDLNAYGFLIVGAGAAICLAYGVLVRFFGMELLMKPVLEDVSCDVPDGADLGPVRIPLRWKLLVALPAINVITGVVVAAVSAGPGTNDLGDLGWDVLVAVVVSFTVSFELVLLLSRSVSDQISALQRGTERVLALERGARVPVLSTDEAGALAASFNTMVAGLEERARLREAFGAFVDPEVVERVMAAGTTDLEGEEVEVSVLFLDIRGFTALAERLSAREVVARLNEFYGHVVPVLERHGGHANKFVGDGLLGVFGAPERLPDHADRAVLAALDIAGTVHDAYRGGLRIGIGVNSGPVLAGTLGGGGHVEFTVIGDAVNTAARVEEVTSITGDEVLITAATRDLLTLPFQGFDERPEVALKGKRERVRLYAPRGAGDVASGAWRRTSTQAPSSTAAGSSQGA